MGPSPPFTFNGNIIVGPGAAEAGASGGVRGQAVFGTPDAGGAMGGMLFAVVSAVILVFGTRAVATAAREEDEGSDKRQRIQQEGSGWIFHGCRHSPQGMCHSQFRNDETGHIICNDRIMNANPQETGTCSDAPLSPMAPDVEREPTEDALARSMQPRTVAPVPVGPKHPRRAGPGKPVMDHGAYVLTALFLAGLAVGMFFSRRS